MKKLFLTIILLFPFLLFSQTFVSLKQCLEEGLQRNYDIRIVRNEQKISDNNYNIGNAGFLPTLDFSSSYSGTLADYDQYPLNDGNKNEFRGDFDNMLNAGIDFNWTIFNGMNVSTNYKQLKEFQEIGELNTRMTIENFMVNMISEYYNFIQQKIQLVNLKSTLRLSKERLRIVEARYNIGSGSGLELQQAKVDFNADSSKFIKQQETLFSSQTKLNQLLAAEDIERQIILFDTSIWINESLTKTELWQKTLDSNTLLLLSNKNIKISLLDLKKAQSDNYPYLKLTAGYGYEYDKYEFATYDRQHYWGLNYGLTVGINIFDGMKRSINQKNIKIDIETKKLDYEQLLISIKSDFATTWMAYRNNMELIVLEKENVELAKSTHKTAIDRYLLGDLSGIELREAQNSLLEAEERLVEAQYNTKLCEILLLQISGQLGKYLE